MFDRQEILLGTIVVIFFVGVFWFFS